MWPVLIIGGAVFLAFKIYHDNENSKKLDQNPARKVLQQSGITPTKPAVTGNPAIDALNKARAAASVTNSGRRNNPASINSKDDEDNENN